MNHQLRLVEKQMEVYKKTIRHQPVTEIDAFEAVEQVNRMQSASTYLFEELGIEVSAYGSTIKKRFVKLEAPKVLESLTDVLTSLLALYHITGLSSHAEAAFEEVHRANMSFMDAQATVKFDQNHQLVQPPNYEPPNMPAVLSGIRPANPFDQRELDIPKPGVRHIAQDIAPIPPISLD